MKVKRMIVLTFSYLLLVSFVFADLPGGGVRWPEQRIRFLNVSSLGRFKLHLKMHSGKDVIINKDYTYVIPSRGGSPTTGLKFFAIFNDESTDTIEVSYGNNVYFHFNGVKNYKLQFSKKTKNSSLSFLGDSNGTNDKDIFESLATSRLDKIMLLLSVFAISTLFFLFKFFKNNSLNILSKPSV